MNEHIDGYTEHVHSHKSAEFKNTRAFYNENKEGINSLLFLVGLMYLNKRVVTKAVAKSISKLTFVPQIDGVVDEGFILFAK